MKYFIATVLLWTLLPYHHGQRAVFFSEAHEERSGTPRGFAVSPSDLVHKRNRVKSPSLISDYSTRRELAVRPPTGPVMRRESHPAVSEEPRCLRAVWEAWGCGGSMWECLIIRMRSEEGSFGVLGWKTLQALQRHGNGAHRGIWLYHIPKKRRKEGQRKGEAGGYQFSFIGQKAGKKTSLLLHKCPDVSAVL